MGCFKNWCLSNFPFMEDDIKALDNYHIMCKLYEYIKNIAGDVAGLTEEYTTLMNSFQELKDYVDQYLVDVEEISNILDSVASQTASNTLRIEQVNTQLTNLINSNFSILKDYIDNNVEELNYKIDNIQIGQIQIYDPTTGLVSPLQTVIDNLYNATNKDGLTASEFDALDLSASGFDAYQITAYEFDSQGKTILV